MKKLLKGLVIVVLVISVLGIVFGGGSKGPDDMSINEQIEVTLKDNVSVKDVRVNENLGTDVEGDLIVLVEDDYSHDLFSARSEMLKVAKDVFKFEDVSEFNFKIVKDTVQVYTGNITTNDLDGVDLNKLSPEGFSEKLNSEWNHKDWK